MYLLVMIRSIFIICVPLFIMLTGYLMNKKELSKKYYKGITRVLIIYVICSIIYHVFSYFYFGTSITIISFLADLVSFLGTRDSWYLELYIGLYLLIPFLNKIFNNLKDKKEANYLLLTLFFLIGIPSVINYYYIILPDLWLFLYPILYYFMGAYLSKYKVEMSVKTNIILLIIMIIISGNINFFTFHNDTFKMVTMDSYESGIVALTAFLVFNLLLKIKVNYTEKKAKVFKRISDACFGAYLLSCIFDALIYDHFYTRTLYAPTIVISIFILSLISSMIINVIYDKVKSIFVKE